MKLALFDLDHTLLNTDSDHSWGEFLVSEGLVDPVQHRAMNDKFYDDYKKGGFSMLPTGKRDTKTALQIILYTIWLILVSIFPAFGLTGRLFLTPIAAVLVLLCGLWMLYAAVQLYKTRTAKAARSLMLVSVSYISLIQIIYIVDKFIR